MNRYALHAVACSFALVIVDTHATEASAEQPPLPSITVPDGSVANRGLRTNLRHSTRLHGRVRS